MKMPKIMKFITPNKKESINADSERIKRAKAYLNRVNQSGSKVKKQFDRVEGINRRSRGR